MAKKPIKEFSKKTYIVFIGILLCLLSIILFLNAGYAAKGISFSFTYVLGFTSYILYGIIFAEGIFLIFKNKGMGLLTCKYFWFAIVLIIGLSGLVTYFLVDQKEMYLSFINSEKEISLFDELHEIIGGYFDRETIKSNFFFGGNEKIGCGLLGYSLLALGNSAFGNFYGGLILSILAMCVGGALIVIFAIVETVAGKKPDAEKRNKDGVNNHQRIKNINVVKDAKKVDPGKYHSEVSGAGRNVRSLSDDFPDGYDSPFSEETLEHHVSERDPMIESLDEFRKPVFELDDLAPAPVISGNYEPLVNNDFMNGVPENEPDFPDDDDGFGDPFKERSFEPEPAPAPVEKPVEPRYEQPVQQQYQQPVRPEPQPRYEEPVRPTFNQPVQPQPQVQPQPKVEPQQNNAQPGVKKPRVNFQVIGSHLLESYETAHALEVNTAMAAERKEIINNTFKDFNVGAEVMDYTIGPSITRYNIRYNSNVSSRAVANLVQDISIRLNGVSARFESVIEGQSTSGLEIPNQEITTVAFKDVYEALPDVKKHPLAIAFGKNIKGSVIYADYDEFPHMLISGTTGSGKSVFVNSIICTLIMRNSPDDLKLVLVDPKKVEMSRYADMPHLLTPIITEPTKVKLVLDKLVDEMEYRYSLFSKNNATNIKEYNEDCEFNGNERMPYILIVLDEYADLVEQCKDISFPVVSIAQKARACGIHIMLSTQRPSTNVVTGVIKANMPTHVALMTANYVDSTTIIGEGGAEKLLGKGDMLVQSPLVSRVGVCRLQSCFINRREIIKIVSELKSKYPTNFDPEFMNLEEQKPETAFAPGEMPEGGGDNDFDTKYNAIKDWVMGQEYMSMSKIQRECGVGFNRAGRIFNRLVSEGIVAAESEGSKGCRVLQQNKFGDISDDDLIPTSEENSYIK